jgi:arylsulfatase A-like enzyme
VVRQPGGWPEAAARFYPLNAGRRTTSPPAPPTPNLTRLAQNGVLFRRAWATPWCSPSRAEILTGRYPFRTGIGDPISKNPATASGELRLDEFTLPEAFQKAKPDQYLLAHVGKWHLSRRGADDPNRHGWPYFAGPRREPRLRHPPGGPPPRAPPRRPVRHRQERAHASRDPPEHRAR